MRAKLTETLVKLNRISDMRLTVEQRLQALERDAVVLHDTIDLLHKVVKTQSQLINDYITRKVASADAADEHEADKKRPENALFTFVCRQRFDQIDKDVAKMRKLIENLRYGLKAG